MTLDTFLTVLAYLGVSLLILGVTVIWITILAAVWVVVTRFIREYRNSAEILKRQEAERALEEEAKLGASNKYLSE